MTRVRLSGAQGTAKSFFAGLAFWAFLAAVQAIGGAVTDQAPTADAAEFKR